MFTTLSPILSIEGLFLWLLTLTVLLTFLIERHLFEKILETSFLDHLDVKQCSQNLMHHCSLVWCGAHGQLQHFPKECIMESFILF